MSGNYYPLRVSSEAQAAYFEALDIKYSVPNNKGGMDDILQGPSLIAKSQQVIGIMGPSGAGKTSMLNCLTLRAFAGQVSGSIKLNGKQLTNETLTTYSYVVAQEERLWTFLTPREIVTMASHFYLGEESSEKIDEVLKQLGLQDCADTRVGNEFFKGLSGGQKRRLSVAIGLIKTPLIFFLDEPTSGLDAASARSLMRTLNDVSKHRNIIVILTIHQPPVDMFLQMDRVLILSAGKTAYFGATKHLPYYLERIGQPLPDNVTNPADHFLDIINQDFKFEKKGNETIEIFEKWNGLSKEIPPEQDDIPLHRVIIKPDLSFMLYRMCTRNLLLIRRDFTKYAFRLVVCLLVNSMFAMMFFHSSKIEQEHLFEHIAVMLFLNVINTTMGIIKIPQSKMDFEMVDDEARNGMYSPFAYLFAEYLVTAIYMVLLGIASILIPGYVIANFYWPNFLYYLLVEIFIFWSCEAFSMFLSLLFENPINGMIWFVPYFSVQFLTATWYIRRSEMYWPLRGFSYISIFQRALEITLFLEFSERNYPECDGGPPQCWGSTGDEIIGNVSKLYGPFRSESKYMYEDFLVINISIVFFFWGYIYLFWKKVRKQTVLKHTQSTKLARIYSPQERGHSFTMPSKKKNLIQILIYYN